MKEKILNLLKSKVFLALVLNIFILIFCIFISSFSYDNSEDFYNSLSICQFHYYYSNSINYILATLIGSAQFALTGFNCFVLAQILLSCLAFTSLTYVITDKFGKVPGVVISLIVNILFALNHYADIQSSKTAAILFAAGFLLVLNAIRNKRYNAPCWIGIIEILFGSFLKYEYFFITLAFAVVFFFAEMIAKRKYKIKFRKFFWFFRPYVLLFVFITALVIGGNQYSYSVNHATEEASNYYTYAQLTDSINEFTFPNYKEHEEEFNAININENDYEMLTSGYYDEDNSLNLSALSLVSEIQQQENTKTVQSEIYEAGSEFGSHFMVFDNLALISILIFLTFGLYVFLHKKRYAFFPIFYLLTAIVSSVYVQFIFTSESFITYGIWLIACFFIIFSFNPEQFKPKVAEKIKLMNKLPILASVIFIALLFLSECAIYQSHLPNISFNDKPSNLYAEIDRHPERYYVLDPSTAFDYLKFTDNYTHPLWGFRSSYLDNIDGFGYFHQQNEMLGHYLPTNIYEAVLTNKQIYVIDNYITFKKEKYIKEHYAVNDSSVTYQQVDEINGFKIYDIQTN